MKFPAFVRTGKDTAKLAALEAIKREVPTSVKMFIEMSVRYVFCVIERVSVRLRVRPESEVSCVSAMAIEPAVVTPLNPKDCKTGRVVYAIPPMVVRDGKLNVFNCVRPDRVMIPETDCKEGPEKEVV